MIDSYEPGLMRIGGKQYRQDLKIVDGRIAPDWWRAQGHRLADTDITDVLEAHPDVLVIGTGYAENMRVPEPTRRLLSGRGIQVVIQDTFTAVRTYNHLAREGRKVAAAFHLTC